MKGANTTVLRAIVLLALIAASIWLSRSEQRAPAPQREKPAGREVAGENRDGLPKETGEPVEESAADENLLKGFVSHVKDGDSLVLQVGTEEKVIRFWGIDTPEGNTKQPFAESARDFTRNACQRKTVSVRVRDQDQYGRVVGEVILEDGTHVNRELVRAGLAWHYDYHAPDEKILAQYQDEARRAKRGLWGGKNPPVPPWDWRREHPYQRP